MSKLASKQCVYKEDLFIIFDEIYKKQKVEFKQVEYVKYACKKCGLTCYIKYGQGSIIRKDVRDLFNKWREERGL